MVPDACHATAVRCIYQIILSSMEGIIVCGGLSTRLGDITKDIPKILLDIGGKTVLDWQLTKLQEVGVNHVVLAAGHLNGVLQRQIGNTRFGLDLTYAVEDKKLGTGGAIKYAWSFLREKNAPVFVLNGDILTTIQFKDMMKYLPSESDGIILAAYVDDVASYGTVLYDKDYHVEAFKEKEGVHKPGYQNGGVYLFTPEIQRYFPASDTFSVEYDVFPKVEQLYVYESDKPWIDVGLPERLAWARENWRTFSV